MVSRPSSRIASKHAAAATSNAAAGAAGPVAPPPSAAPAPDGGEPEKLEFGRDSADVPAEGRLAARLTRSARIGNAPWPARCAGAGALQTSRDRPAGTGRGARSGAGEPPAIAVAGERASADASMCCCVAARWSSGATPERRDRPSRTSDSNCATKPSRSGARAPACGAWRGASGGHRGDRISACAWRSSMISPVLSATPTGVEVGCAVVTPAADGVAGASAATASDGGIAPAGRTSGTGTLAVSSEPFAAGVSARGASGAVAPPVTPDRGPGRRNTTAAGVTCAAIGACTAPVAASGTLSGAGAPVSSDAPPATCGAGWIASCVGATPPLPELDACARVAKNIAKQASTIATMNAPAALAISAPARSRWSRRIAPPGTHISAEKIPRWGEHDPAFTR
jgi:hypothetical protein